MGEEGGEVPQMRWTEDKRCIEWEFRREHKRQKNKKCNGCMQEESEADRVAKSY
jgi:hypothetical protein